MVGGLDKTKIGDLVLVEDVRVVEDEVVAVGAELEMSAPWYRCGDIYLR